MKKTILDEAMEDAKLIKETAVENAKNVLVEAISPRIKEYVNSQLTPPVVEVGEEQDELESDEMDLEKEAMYEENGEEEEEEVKEAEEKGEEEEEEIQEAEEKGDEEDDEEIQITQEDLQKAFSELLGDIKSEASVTKGFSEPDDATLPASGGKGEKGIAGDEKEDQQWSEEEPPDAKDWSIKETQYKKSIQSLKKENKLYKQTCDYLKRNLQEVNLFNSKLLHTNKVFQMSSLNNKQRLSVIEAFDKASNLREVELVYNSLSESLKIAGVLSETRKNSGSKNAKTSRVMKPSSTLHESVNREEENSYAKRMQELAGLLE